jgi:hypothetical protein
MANLSTASSVIDWPPSLLAPRQAANQIDRLFEHGHTSVREFRMDNECQHR